MVEELIEHLIYDYQELHLKFIVKNCKANNSDKKFASNFALFVEHPNNIQ
jgi:hypothetical protein